MPVLLKLLLCALFFSLVLVSAAIFATAAETYASEQITIKEKTIFDVALSLAGDRVAIMTHEDQMIHIFDVSNGKELAPLATGDGDVAYIAWSPDSSLLLAAKRKEIILFDVASGKQRGVIGHGFDNTRYYARFSPDSKTLILAGEDRIGQLWDVATLQKTTTLPGPNSAFLGAKFSPDGKSILEEPSDNSLRIWDIASKAVTATMKGHSNYIDDEWFSADGTRVLSVAKDRTARVWDAGNGSQIAKFQLSDYINSAAFDAAGKRVVTSSDDGAARVFDIESGKEIATLRADGMDQVKLASFSPNGSRIVTYSNDRKLRIWNAADGKELIALDAHSLELLSVRFSSDGETIFTTDRASAIIWKHQKAAAESSSATAEGATGIWYSYPDGVDMSDDIVHAMCAYTPMKIDADGLAILYQGSTDYTLRVESHLRCKADMSCQSFAGAPSADVSTPSDTVTIKLVDGRGDVCSVSNPTNCTHIARCPDMKWTDDERKGGYADLWEKQVMAPPN